MMHTAILGAKREWTELEAVRCAASGDAEAFEYIYNTHCKHVFSVCLRLVKNQAEAEDLTQQVFLRLFRKLGTFRGDSRLSTWLHRVTVNTVLMHWRRQKPTTCATESLEDIQLNRNESGQRGFSDTSMLGAIDALNLKRAIRKLPSGCKRLFLLHDFFGFKHKEIARMLRCTAGCSKSQVHRARKRLRHLLQGEDWQAAASR